MKENGYAGRIGNSGTQVVKAPDPPRHRGRGKVRKQTSGERKPAGGR